MALRASAAQRSSRGGRGSRPADGSRSLAEQRGIFSVRNEAGQSLIELGFAVPIVLLVILALVDFGRGISMWLDTTHVANEGARLAAVDSAPCDGAADLQHCILKQAYPGLQSTQAGLEAPARVCISFPNPTGADGAQRGDPVSVTITAKYDWFPGGLIPGSFALGGSSTMRLEQDPTFPAGCT